MWHCVRNKSLILWKLIPLFSTLLISLIRIPWPIQIAFFRYLFSIYSRVRWIRDEHRTHIIPKKCWIEYGRKALRSENVWATHAENRTTRNSPHIRIEPMTFFQSPNQQQRPRYKTRKRKTYIKQQDNCGFSEIWWVRVANGNQVRFSRNDVRFIQNTVDKYLSFCWEHVGRTTSIAIIIAIDSMRTYLELLCRSEWISLLSLFFCCCCRTAAN